MQIDKYKMIYGGKDGGDTCHRMYTFWFRKFLLCDLGLIDGQDLKNTTKTVLDIAQTQSMLEVDSGIYIRNPDPNEWYSDPRNVSRDQLVPVICLWAYLSFHFQDKNLSHSVRSNLRRLLWACLSRGMFAQNIYPNGVDPRKEKVEEKMPDFINFELWGIFARGFVGTLWFPLALPFVLFGDFALIISALVKVFAPVVKNDTLIFKSQGLDDVDDDNMNNVLMATQYVFPTPMSWLARKIYKKFRKINNGNVVLGEKSTIMGALRWYHHKDNPELAELARPLVERY
jgi:hypothetical protein